jgi:rSAM/selenodomain-associated transferase 1
MERLTLFAKQPRLGKVKTRLIPALSADQALLLYHAFVEDQIDFVKGFGDRRMIELCTDAPWNNVPAGISLREQGPGDLGERMLRAFRRSHAEGAPATVIIGADCPTLPTVHVERAFQLLASGVEALLSPADDGGYVLVGLTTPRPELFHAVPWGTAQVLDITRSRAREHGIVLEEIEGWYDVDDIGDIDRLRRDPSLAVRAPATARCLGSLAL